MSFLFSYEHSTQFSVAQNIQSILSFLTNYSKSIGHLFPGLASFSEKNSTGLYHWEFVPLQYGGKSFVIAFDTVFEEKDNEVLVHPVTTKSQPQLTGRFHITPSGQLSKIALSFRLELVAPFPSLSKAIISPLATKELDKLFVEYDRNLKNSFQ